MHFLRSILWSSQWQTQFVQPFQIEAERDQWLNPCWCSCLHEKGGQCCKHPWKHQKFRRWSDHNRHEMHMSQTYTTFQNAWQFLSSVRDLTTVCLCLLLPASISEDTRSQTHTHTHTLDCRVVESSRKESGGCRGRGKLLSTFALVTAKLSLLRP